MKKTICQHALDRVILYLQSYGVEPSRPVCRKALALIDECLEDAGVRDAVSCDAECDLAGRLLVRVFDRLPRVFDLPELDLPDQRPPIKRGSIGYGPPV